MSGKFKHESLNSGDLRIDYENSGRHQIQGVDCSSTEMDEQSLLLLIQEMLAGLIRFPNYGETSIEGSGHLHLPANIVLDQTK